MSISPRGMKVSFFIDVFEGVPSEEVPLRLRQISGQPLRIQIAQRIRKSRARHTVRDADSDDTSPRRRPFIQNGSKTRIDHQVFEILVGREGFLNIVEKCRTDNASSGPKAGAFGKINVPTILVRSSLDQTQALRVAANL